MSQQCQQLSKCELMRRIDEYFFALYDLSLYLDTHPDDCGALSNYHSLNEQYQEYYNEYIKTYGPIAFTDVKSEDYWTWVAEEWPWEGGMA
ncbi:MAG: spore coat protein CotJB [Butyrivibrio sp.]|nr:spore coat protein CotJB [Butyrivibrio sp.]